MIRYALHCTRGHAFEGWFGSSADFDGQQEQGLLECPICGSREVAKALMAPAVSGTRQSAGAPAGLPAAGEGAGEGSMEARPPALQLAGLTHEQQAIVAQMRELKRRLLAQAEDVGARFSEEARKIHYGETPERSIYGQASPQEAADLLEEGIDCMPLPDLPEDSN